ncbi:MAG: FecR domain-containing protein [Steroidobacteraceae bacterium]
MNARSFASLFSKFVLGLLAVPLLGSAQNLSTSDDQDVDPPGRVARVNLIEGSAALRPVGADAWVDDVLNRPLGSGDQLWVESDSRAELHVGSTSVRLGARSGLAIVYVDDRQAQLRLNAGAADIRVRELQSDEHFEVQTPDYTIAIRTPGDYRVDVNDEGNLTLLSVRSGSAEVSHGSQFYRVAAGQRGAFDSNGGSAEIAGLPAPDALDRWSDERDGREDNSQAARYVSRDVIGYEALDGYGTWAAEPDYGNVWIPTVAAGWTPFYYGHWVYIAPWGWTWIDDAPWGFAPCHYGRWVHLPRNGGRWAWVPGPRRVERPMYAPALVVWMGNPGAGRVGWMPLGYRDVYVPPYRVSNGYARRVNLANAPVTATVVDDFYRNPGARARRYAHEGVAGAVVTVSRDTFESARPVQRGAQRPPVRDIQASVGNGVAPGRSTAAALPQPTQRSFGRVAAQPRDVSAPVQRAVEQQRSVARPGAPARNPGPAMNPGARGQAAQPTVQSGQQNAPAVRGRDRDERDRQGGDARNGGPVQRAAQPAAATQSAAQPVPQPAQPQAQRQEQQRAEQAQRQNQQRAEQQRQQQAQFEAQQREQQQREQQQREQQQRQQQARQQAQQRQQQAQREREEKKKKDDHDRE